MLKNTIKKIPLLYKTLQVLNRFINKILKKMISCLNSISLKYFFKIKKTGKRISFSRGFKVYNGANNITIGSNVYLENALLNAGDIDGFIIIEDFVFFGHGVMILARGHDYNKTMRDRQDSTTESPIMIKSGAWIGSGSIILGGVTVGKNAVVGAGSIVTKDVEENSIVAGNPAKLIKYIK
jgi:acetyltransferase-like isoleucine patch superfamily enzyme